jgi:hypothetical protein
MTVTKKRSKLLAALFALSLVTGSAQQAIAGPKGNGATKGNAQSDPDDNGKGPDRGDGGPDRADGNNGCGNDADRSDDNEGWCGNKHDDGGDTGGDDGGDTGGDDGGDTGGDPCVADPNLPFCGGAS